MIKVLRYSLYAFILVLGTEILNASTLITVDNSTTLITVNTKKPAKDETRKVSGFNGISSAGSFDIIVTMGNTESLRLDGDADDIAKIETVVEDGILKIRTKKGTSWVKSTTIGDVDIYITARSLKSLTLSGSGEIDVRGVIKGEEMKNTVSGSGSIELSVDVVNYSGTVTGSGDLKVKGQSQNAKITVSGSGEFEGDDFRTETSSARVTGSGEISLHASKALNAVTTGSGDIRYRGNASIKSSSTGSGKIVKL